MSTSSITKDFYVYDPAAFERLKKELSEGIALKEKTAALLALKKGREKLAAFEFRQGD